MIERKQYRSYLKSQKWQSQKDKLFTSRRKYQCEVCRSLEHLHVHHKSYKRVGAEKLSDLCYLCAACHQFLHFLLKAKVSTRYNTWNTVKKLKKRCLRNRLKYLKQRRYDIPFNTGVNRKRVPSGVLAQNQ